MYRFQKHENKCSVVSATSLQRLSKEIEILHKSLQTLVFESSGLATVANCCTGIYFRDSLAENQTVQEAVVKYSTVLFMINLFYVIQSFITKLHKR